MALTQEEMEQMPKPIEQAFSDLELKILEDIVARIKENNMITGTAEYDIFQLVKMGESETMIKRYVEKTLKLTYSEIEDIFGDVFERGYNRDSDLYKAVGADFVAYKDNKQLQQFIGAIKDQTKGTYKNITNTMGFVRQREGVKTWVPLTKYYKDTLSRAVFEITSGAFTYSQVVKRTINEMTNSGIRTIDYASGRTSRIEVAARRAIMTAVTQVTAKVTEQNMDKLHTDYVEVSWHETARPTHQVWQGRVFKWNRGNGVNTVSDKNRSEEQTLENDSFAEGFLVKEKGQKIPENIEKVIEEAKVKEGVKNVAKAGRNDILITGARIIDPDSAKGVNFAEMYYKEIRSFSTDVEKIADNLGKDKSDIRKIKEYLFENKSWYNPETKEYERFKPDCAIAQSWQRLMNGKDIKKHDRTLIEHELLEMKIKEENPDIDHLEAHILASAKYNYPKEVREYYGYIEKHNKNRK